MILIGYIRVQSLTLLLRLLIALGYKCDSPEFEFINELLHSKDLNKLTDSTNIQSVKFAKRNRQNSFPINQYLLSAA